MPPMRMLGGMPLCLDPVAHEIGEHTVAELERIHGYKIDTMLRCGCHLYWSTHCRHDSETGHAACSAWEITAQMAFVDAVAEATIERTPAQCKTCAAPCRCDCHKG